MKNYLVLLVVLLHCAVVSAQKATYDITTYAIPAGWKEEKANGFISYSRVEEWSKSASGRNTEWGKPIKTTARKLETVTYRVGLTYLSGMEKTYLQLASNRPTVRDGRQSNDDKALHQFSYSPGTPGKPLIVLP